MLANALAEFKKENKIAAEKTCALGTWVNQLSEEDKKEAENLFFDDPISNHKVHLFLRSIDVHFSVETIRKHRMRGCACLWTN